MAIYVFEDCFTSIANNELKATKVVIEDGNTEIPATRAGDTAPNSIPGAVKQSITMTFLQDYSSGQVHATLDAALAATRAGNTVAVVVRPDSGAASATNPEYSGAMKLFEYKPLDAGWGEKQDVVATFKTAGTALTKNTGA